MATIEAFINQSPSCKQHIRIQCHHAKLKDYSWLKGRGGQTLGFCAGSCNCDINDEKWRSDEVLLTKKEVLPITGIAIGDTGNPSRSERLLYTIGPLFCALL